MTPKLQRVMQLVGQHLDEIRAELFKPGVDVKLTFIARDPSTPEADILVSEDSLSELAELLIRSGKRDDVRTAPAADQPGLF